MKYIILFLLPILTWSNAKNILFIISDDLKADALNCYGNKSAHTPNIDKLASEGTLFKMLIARELFVLPLGQVL